MCSISVFIPEKIKILESGFLTGKYFSGDFDSEKNSIILAIDDNVEEEEPKDSIGVISNRQFTRGQRKSPWIVFETKPFFIISSIVIDGRFVNFENVNLVIYNSCEIRKSYLLSKNDSCCNGLSEGMDHFIQRVKGERSFNSSPNRTVSTNVLTKYICLVWIFVSSFLKLVLKSVDKMFRKFDVKSYSVDQLLHRLNQINKLISCVNRKENLIAIRIIGVLVVDILFGLFSFYFLYNWTSASQLNFEFQSTTKAVAGNVQSLLSWLKGAPAGLKLNQPLTESLASFFSYHVYLWTLYLEVANPVLVIITHLYIFVGLLGVSIQIGLLADFLNLAVLHVHCFYIYAARLHMLQMSLLGSHWRGFRGRKWNPLKERVDTQSERRQRPLIKIIWAVGFTLVIFLLPTTVVYYAVFVTLRLFMMGLQGLVALVLWVLNFNPVFVACLHVFGSPLLKGEVCFEMIPGTTGTTRGPIEIRLRMMSSPLKEALAASHSNDIFPLRPKPDIAYIWKSLIYAQELL